MRLLPGSIPDHKRPASRQRNPLNLTMTDPTESAPSSPDSPASELPRTPVMDAGPPVHPLAPMMGVIGAALGCTVYYFLVELMGIRVEMWYGIETFADPRWFAVVAVVPAVSGLVTGLVAGRYGKWYGLLPVAILHPIEFYQLSHQPSQEYVVLGYGLFLFFMVIMLELGLMGGWLGELARKRMGGSQARA